MIPRTLVYKGRTISIDIPDALYRTEDDRCDECRANNIAVCHHHAHDNHEPPPPTPMQQTAMPGHGHSHPAAAPGHDHHHEPATEQHEHPEPADPSQPHAGHGVPFKVTIDGRSFDAYAMPNGKFYTHERPFIMYPTPGDLARSIANKLDMLELSRGR